MQDVIEDKPMLNHFVELTSSKLMKTDLQGIFEKHLDDKLFQKSMQVEDLKALLKDIPEINEARALYFRSKIQLNDYKINNSSIAKKLINLEIA